MGSACRHFKVGFLRFLPSLRSDEQAFFSFGMLCLYVCELLLDHSVFVTNIKYFCAVSCLLRCYINASFYIKKFVTNKYFPGKMRNGLNYKKQEFNILREHLEGR